MTGTTEPLPGTDEELGCYSGLYSTRARLVTPRTKEELRQRFAEARAGRRSVTLRAGGHCFDSQALGSDIAISMLGMDSIEVLASEHKVRVGSGARWGDILAELKPHGLVPTVTVTTENATAGGTLSGDCLSRFSPTWGKEGEQIESFELLTTEGELIKCTRPPDEAPKDSWTREQRAFMGAIGGLGYLGAVVSITYRVQSAANPGERFGVKVLARRTDTVDDLAERLMPAVERALTEVPDARDPDKLDGIWSALDMRDDGANDALLFTSAFTTETGGKPMLLHRPYLVRRLLAEWAMRWPPMAKVLWWFYVRSLFKNERQTYIDELEGYTFFMDGNARAKRIAKRWTPLKMQNAQQTFVVPGNPLTPEGRKQAQEDLMKWLRLAHERFEKRRLEPTLTDVLFLPEDRSFALSASAGMPGFACSYAFETSNSKRLRLVQETFSELAEVLWEEFHGRVYLVKNVFAKPETLKQMYGARLQEFVELKDELDPSGTLSSKFLLEKVKLATR